MAVEANDESPQPELAAAFDAPASRPGRVEFGRYVGWVAGATLLVAVLPTAFVWWLRTDGIIRSPLLTLVVALVATLAASRLGTAYWEKRTSPGDLLFGELLLWGFIRRCNSERRLSSARAVLGSLGETPRGADGKQTVDVQAEALQKLSAALEATDPYTHGHSRRVARHCWMIAKRMGLDSDTVDRVRTAAALHDVGKVYTPSSVLRKPGRLTDEEFDIIKRHPVDGAEMVKALGDEELVSIVRHHHERLDGTGYPDRLVRDEIPIGARIISVADTFDAITSARPYRPARAHKKALDILKYEAGTQLDPAVVKAFCAIYSGRRPLALWASFTSLPSQVFSWLGAGAASAASAAQVAAVAAAAAVGATAVVQAHHVPRRHHTSHLSATADVTGRVPSESVAARAASIHAAVHSGSTHKPSGPSHGAATAPAGTTVATQTTGSTGTTQVTGDSSASQNNAPANTSLVNPGDSQGGGEGSGKSTTTTGTGTQTTPETAGESTTTGAPKTPTAPKEGSGSKEGSASKEAKKLKEEEAKKLKEEEKRAKEEARKLKEEEAKKLKEEEAKKAKEAKQLKEEEAKKAKEAEKKAKEEKAAKEGKSTTEEKRSKEGKGVVKEVVEVVETVVGD